MLKITVPPLDLYDEVKNEFFTLPAQELQLEHSLVSVSKWESKWKKPFLTKEDKTPEETIDYIKAMTITQNVDPDIYKRINQPLIDIVVDYIGNPMTATTFSQTENAPSREIITSELIYYWMVAFTIPFECQKWHLNRLLTLIRVCSVKNQPKKKLSKGELLRRNRELNAIRKAQLGTSG